MQFIEYNAGMFLQTAVKSPQKSQLERYFSGTVTPRKRCAVCAASDQNFHFSRDPTPIARWLNDPSLSMEIDRRLHLMPKKGSAEERLIEIYKRI